MCLTQPIVVGFTCLSQAPLIAAWRRKPLRANRGEATLIRTLEARNSDAFLFDEQRGIGLSLAQMNLPANAPGIRGRTLCPSAAGGGFTLIELLVVIAIIAIL